MSPRTQTVIFIIAWLAVLTAYDVVADVRPGGVTITDVLRWCQDQWSGFALLFCCGLALLVVHLFVPSGLGFLRSCHPVVPILVSGWIASAVAAVLVCLARLR